MRKRTARSPERLALQTSSEMDAGERDLLESGCDDAIDLADHVVDRDAARQAARRRDDAIRARLRAAGLDAQRVRGAAHDAGFDWRAAWPLSRTKRVFCVFVREQLNQSWLVVVFHDAHNIRQRRDFVRTTRRVAPRDDDLRRRIVACDTANRLPRALIGGRRHRASIDNDQICFVRRRVDGTSRAQFLLESKRVRLIHPAAERDDCVLQIRNPQSAIRNAERPMSCRYCIPSNEICMTPA